MSRRSELILVGRIVCRTFFGGRNETADLFHSHFRPSINSRSRGGKGMYQGCRRRRCGGPHGGAWKGGRRCRMRDWSSRNQQARRAEDRSEIASFPSGQSPLGGNAALAWATMAQGGIFITDGLVDVTDAWADSL